MAMKDKMTAAAGWVRRHWLISLLTAAVLAGGLWWLAAGRQGDKQDIPPVKADGRILAEGIVFPVRYAQMVMPVDGTVGEVLAREGDKVAAGQPLIRLVRQDYAARVGSARADVARAALAQTEADMATQESRRTEAEGLLDKTELRAPMTGTVAYLDVKVGEHASLGTVLVRIADETAWEVRSDDLTELAVAKIRVGDAATLTFDGVPGLEIPGRVKFIRPFGEKKRGDITYTVTIAPDRWDARLRWNMTAQIAITPAQGR